MATQPAEYREAVGVYIPPVVNSSITQPGSTFEPLDRIASTKNGETPAAFGQRQEVDLVLSHEYSFTPRGVRDELGERHRRVCNATAEHKRAIEPAEANQWLLKAQPEAPLEAVIGEAAHGCVDGLGRQHSIQPLAEYRSVL